MDKNNIVCMECTDSCDFFYVAVDCLDQRCDGSFGDDGGASTCVLKRLLPAVDVHFGEGMGNPTFEGIKQWVPVVTIGANPMYLVLMCFGCFDHIIDVQDE